MTLRPTLLLLVAAGCGGAPVRETVQSSPPPKGWVRTAPPTGRTEKVSAPPTKVADTVLPNGLRVVIVEHHRRPIVSIRTVFGQGAAQDRKAVGSTYFAVSLLPGLYEVDEDGQPVVEADSFARKVFYLGGAVTLDVAADHSLIGIDGYSKDANRYLDMLSEAIRRPRSGPRSFALSRSAMINSLEEVELSDSSVFQLFIQRAAFGAGHPYARPVFGSIDSLKLLGLNEVKDRQRELLTPAGSTLLIVGDVYPGPTLAAVRSTFGKWSRRDRARSRRIRPPRTRSTSRVQLIPRSPAASMVVCAARPLSDIRQNDAGLEVLAQILGGGLDSRLGSGLRMKNGVSYSMSASIIERKYAKALVACTRVRAKDTTLALKVFRRALQSMVTSAPTSEELARAKRQLTVRRGGRYASVQSTVHAWLQALSKGKSKPEREPDVERVTAAQVHALAKKVLLPRQVRFLLGGSAKRARVAAQEAGLGQTRTVRLDL